METTFSSLLIATILFRGFMICISLHNQKHVPPGFCYRVKFSINEDVTRDHALEGHVFKRSTVDDVIQCHVMCRDDCRCLSMNYLHNTKEDNCELNDVKKEMKQATLHYRFGIDYYDFVSDFTCPQKGLKTSTPGKDHCFNKCCEVNPCLQGGTCKEICDPTNARFNCTCPDDYTGQRCEKIKYPRSCKDLVTNGVKISGMYNVYDSQSNPYQVYCDFDSEVDFVWTLAQSFSLRNIKQFDSKIFVDDFPVNEEAFNWESYRLSLSRMQSIVAVSSHLRVTCNFPKDGLVFTDYARAQLAGHDLFGTWEAQCRMYELVNIRGIECRNCTAATWQRKGYTWHVNSYLSALMGCEFNGTVGAVSAEQNFGRYSFINSAHRCSSSAYSTTQYWIGSKLSN